MDEILNELKKIRKILQRKKEEYDLTFADTETSIKIQFPIPMKLHGGSKIGLKLLSTYYSIPNINSQNNVFKYSIDGVSRELELETGCYEVKNIADKIKDFQQNYFTYNVETNDVIKKNLDLVELKPDPSTMKCVITIPQSVTVDFTQENSVCSALGFSHKLLTSGVHVSDLSVDINPVNTIMVHCDIATGSIHNGQPSKSIYQFAPKVAPGYKIVEEARQITYHNIPHDEINGIHVWLTDQDGNMLDNRNERLLIQLHMII
jgi:hypothetical protein